MSYQTTATTMTNDRPIQDPNSAFNRLVRRMLNFQGNFDGYPTTSCTDEELIFAAHDEASANGSSLNVFDMLCGITSAFVTTREQYAACKAFMQGYFEANLLCAMSEGGNPVLDEIANSTH